MTDNEKAFPEKGRPRDFCKRLPKEQRVYEFLDSLGIEYYRIDHEHTDRMEACAAIDTALSVKICKNLFLCNRQKTQYYILMMPADKPFRTRLVSPQIGSARLSFGEADVMEQLLDVTPGSVSIMGLINDKENKVRLLVDADIVEKEYVGCHPCINTTSLRLRSSDIFGKFLDAVHHDMTVLEIPYTEE